MTKTQFLTLTCAVLVGSACSGGPNKGTTGTTGSESASTTSSGSSSGGATGTSGTGGTSTGAASGGPSSSGTTTGPAAPDFALSLTPNTLTLPEGGQRTVQINIQRDAGGTPDTDLLNLGLLADAGINGLINPFQNVAGGAAALTIDLDPSVLAGNYLLTINASSASNPQSAHSTNLSLTVSSQVVTTLLVDNDASENNADGGGLPSPSDAFFGQLLQSAGIVYNTFVISSTGTDTFDSDALANYTTVVWYTGANNSQVGNGCLSSFQEQFLEMWLDQGGKQLLMFSPFLVQDLSPVHFWQDPPADQFLSLYLGAEGSDQNPQQLFDGQSFVATGVDGTAFTAEDGGEDGGLSFQVAPTPIADTAGVINPGDGGTAPLVTIAADELGVGEPQAVPCTVINSHSGQAGTSTVVFVGMPIEDIQGSDAGSADAFFQALEQSLP